MSESDETCRIAAWPPNKIAEAVDGRLRGSDRSSVRAVSTDTRTLEPGALFLALRGERFDAHEFVGDAVEKGAVGCILAREPADSEFRESVSDGDCWWIEVDDTERALVSLGEAIWREATDDGLHTIDVTGSNGKTTTKELLSALWGSRGDCYATPGNYNNRIGVSLTLCGLPERVDHAVIELGANAPGEIDELVRMAPGSERIITSIAPAHLEGFGSVDGVRRAKSEIAVDADEGDVMIVPESEVDKLYLEEFPGRIVTFGPASSSSADVQYERESAERDSAVQRVTLRGLDRVWRVPLGLPGAHNASNLAAAVTTGWVRGAVFGEDAAEALRSVELPSGRWRRQNVDGLRFVDDAYNANPGSIEASLQAFLETESEGERSSDSVILVVGDIAEMGEDADAWHRRVGGRIAEIAGQYDGSTGARVDAIWAVGEHRRALLDGFEETAQYDSIATMEAEAVEEAAAWLTERRPATIWMKASRAAELERLVPAVRERLAGAPEE